MEIIKRFLKVPEQSFFLFGPRGTGKSTWVRDYYPDALLIDLLAPEVYRSYIAHPERLRELVDGNPNRQFVIIDEIQKVPELLNTVHMLMESKKNIIQFILTGSSTRKLKKAGVDLLAGRALLKTMHPFILSELRGIFTFEEILRLGLLPVVLNSKDPSDVLNSYVSLYLREEVQMEGMIRNIGDFARFLEIISFSHSSVLNVANIARESEIGRKTVEGYINILEDLLLAYRIPVFTKRASRSLIKHSKFYLFDTGVFRSLRPAGPFDRQEEIEGSALEGLVAQHLRAWIAYSGNKSVLYFWRTPSGTEVDFVVYGPETFYAIEVKNSDKVRPLDLQSLKTFITDYPSAKAILLYRGSDRLKKNNILCLPCSDFLSNLQPGMLLLETCAGM
ncbi:MAG: ATPase [Candidatus Schekmanbacteria bacterium RBG_13_48_7]|uniref:ATPase n=1 Tax=Candidatus Schekmanbacteria bacterium RBG_13_48_7 TaxID=1817878 RepID=A0A1F7RPX8_9BACT|nr:MAG: ATPase [Candidatus Schekmanbacteria bacterium RBG_13_48_7]